MTKTTAEKALKVISQLELAKPYDMTLHRLAGDASDRRYFHISYGAFGEKKNVVMMELADPTSRLKSEEVTLYHDESGELPFLNIGRFLQDIGSPVPKILLSDLETGVLILEDLGDVLLLDIFKAGEREKTNKLYRRAVETLVYLQVEGTKRLPSSCMASQQSFTADLFHWEFRHFIEYGIEARGEVLPEKEKQGIDELCRRLSEHLAALPPVFTHRDYHSRNLMVKNGDLYMIDFQDALMGPATYDLASLLRDSYLDLGWDLVDELLEYYFEARAKRNAPVADRDAFAQDLWITAAQRNLKAAGRFVYIERVKNKPGYEQDIPRTLSYFEGYANRAPQLAELVDLLRPWVPELKG